MHLLKCKFKKVGPDPDLPAFSRRPRAKRQEMFQINVSMGILLDAGRGLGGLGLGSRLELKLSWGWDSGR